MGGCRCHFRNCDVGNTKFPRMHFFRFPLKDPERYRKWRQYSKMEHMLKFSEVRCANTAICGRHFRIECFMNYKMDRLVRNAVPTLMRLSHDQALDFEQDIENGVLVTLEKTKLKHLMPPVGFECPLYLENDKVLLEKLPKIQSQQHSSTNADVTDIECMDQSLEYEDGTIENTKNPLVNSVEILETVKKIKILNTTNCASECNIKSENSIVLVSQTDHNDSIDFVEIDQMGNTQELMNSESQFLRTSEAFVKADSRRSEDSEHDTEYLEVHNSENSLLCEPQANSSTSHEISELQNKLFVKSQDIDILKLKYSLVEAENGEMKKVLEINKDLTKKLLSMKVKYHQTRRILKEYKTMKGKLQELYEENKKLEASNNLLKAELLSRKEETKELRKLLDLSKKTESKGLKKIFEIENKQSNFAAKETQLNNEIEILKIELNIEQEKFKDTEIELIKTKDALSDAKKENEKLAQYKKELEQSINNMQSSIDIRKNEYETLKEEYEKLQQKHVILEQNSISKINSAASASTSVNSLSKAKLFNGIKRYLSASMVSLLRMEMFGGSEREWKNDERQVAVDILRLGEVVYKYFIDEWRFRLPDLRDVRNWLNESQIEEEDVELI